MKILSGLLAIFLAAPAFAQSTTDRAKTDAQLKIASDVHLLKDKDLATWQAKRNETSTPPKYSRIWGKSDVLLIEPKSEKTPATCDFSALTNDSKGQLIFKVRNHPDGDVIMEIDRSGKPFKNELIGNNNWRTFVVPYDHEPIVLKAIANGWFCEFLFFTYDLKKSP